MADEQTIAQLEAACTDKERVFAYAFVETLNQSEAGRRAKLNASTDNSLHQMASVMRRRPHVRALIDALLEDITPTNQEIIAALVEIAFGASLADYLKTTRRGFNIDLRRAEADGRLHLVKSITKSTRGTKIELYDRLTALTTLAKIKGMFIERVEGRMDVVQMTLDEWRRQRDERRADVAVALDLIDDEEADA